MKKFSQVSSYTIVEALRKHKEKIKELCLYTIIVILIYSLVGVNP